MKIGIDIGGSHINVGLVEDCSIIDKIDHVWTTDEKKDIYNTMKQSCIKYIEEICNNNSINVIDLDVIGIGFPYRNIRDGIIYLENEKIDIPKAIKEKYNIPVYLKNDVKCSSLCEKRIGSIKEYENALFLTLGTGIGGAYFYKNEQMKPKTYQGMEIGHMIIDMNGRKCRCGKNGCFEEYASMRAFRNKIRELYNIEDVNSSIALDLYYKKEKEEEYNNIIDEYIEYLSIGLSNLVNILEPDAICIGGSFVHYEELFMNKLENKLQSKFINRKIPKILLAKYGNDAGIIGASMLISN